MTQPTFNLIDEPWIGAVDENGTLKEYGLRELLAQAHHLRSLHDDSPLVIAAVLRMILALLHRIYDGPRNSREWEVIWAANDGFDMARIERYFVQWHSRFDLFDAEYPFYQTIHAAVDKQIKPISTLLPELATGNNATLFDHTTDASDVAHRSYRPRLWPGRTVQSAAKTLFYRWHSRTRHDLDGGGQFAL
jgi:CRISPR system Cascade subunit CasA